MTKRNLKSLAAVGLATMLLAACNYSQVPANLQQKLDSVKALEKLELLKAQGIRVGEDTNPFRQFYDSLAIQALPVSSTDDYLAELPNYETVPQELMQLLNLEGQLSTKAIALPETAGMRLLLVATDEGENRFSLWLYTLGADYLPVDRLCLYSPTVQQRKDGVRLLTEFSITSDYEIFLTTTTASHKTKRQRIFTVDELLQFKEWKIY